MTLSRYEAAPPDRRTRMSRRALRGFDPKKFVERREAADLRVSDLARISGTAQSTIHHWEAGTRSPQIDVLAKVMKILKAPIEAVVIVPVHERYPGDWRVMKGLNQPQLALAAHMRTNRIQRIESADYPLSDKDAATIAKILDVSVKEYRAAYDRARDRPAGTPA